MGYHVHIPYILQVAAELAYGDSHAVREGISWHLYDMCEEGVNSEFSAEEDIEILERSGKIQEWWETELGSPIDFNTLDKMYNNYIAKVRDILLLNSLTLI